MDITQRMVTNLFKELLNVDLGEMPHLTYAEAMHNALAAIAPDLRIPLELEDIKDLMQAVDFKVFSGPAKDPKGRVAALRVPGGGKLSRKEIDEYTKFVSIYGAKGLAWIKVNDVSQGLEGLQSPIIKFMPEDVVPADAASAGRIGRYYFLRCG